MSGIPTLWPDIAKLPCQALSAEATVAEVKIYTDIVPLYQPRYGGYECYVRLSWHDAVKQKTHRFELWPYGVN